MDKGVLIHACVALCGVFISAISQAMLKKAAMQNHNSAIKEYLNPLVVCAYILFIGTTFVSIYAYKGIPLSFGPILEATSYIYITFFGVKFFGEKINKKKIVALLLIIMGIVCYAVVG